MDRSTWYQGGVWNKEQYNAYVELIARTCVEAVVNFVVKDVVCTESRVNPFYEHDCLISVPLPPDT